MAPCTLAPYTLHKIYRNSADSVPSAESIKLKVSNLAKHLFVALVAVGLEPYLFDGVQLKWRLGRKEDTVKIMHRINRLLEDKYGKDGTQHSFARKILKILV